MLLTLTDLIVEATPPRLIVSLCSVKASNLDNGNSTSTSSPNGSDDLGVKKKPRPAGVCGGNRRSIAMGGRYRGRDHLPC